MEFDENFNPITPPDNDPAWGQPYEPNPQPQKPTPTPEPIKSEPQFVPQPQAKPNYTPPISNVAHQPKSTNNSSMMWVVIVLAILAFAAIVWGGNGANVSVDNSNLGLTVVGEGKAYATPDVAKINFAVRSESKDITGAQQTNSETIAKIKDALSSYKIATKDIKTVNYSINPEYTYNQNSAPYLRGYSTYHAMEITVRKLEDTDAIVQTLGGAGITEISQVEFTVDDPSEVQNDARDKAITQAKEKAKQLAGLSGAKLGRIISIKEQTSANDIQPYAKYEGMGGSATSTPGLEQGNVAISSQISITYSLK